MHEATPGWSLEDGEVMAARHPDTFHVAPLATPESLQPGDYAKLMIDFRDGTGTLVTERMWTVVFANEAGRYRGRLVNEPSVAPADRALRFGVEIAYEARHIIDWNDADDRSRAFVADPRTES